MTPLVPKTYDGDFVEQTTEFLSHPACAQHGAPLHFKASMLPAQRAPHVTDTAEASHRATKREYSSPQDRTEHSTCDRMYLAARVHVAAAMHCRVISTNGSSQPQQPGGILGLNMRGEL